MRHAECLL